MTQACGGTSDDNAPLLGSYRVRDSASAEGSRPLPRDLGQLVGKLHWPLCKCGPQYTGEGGHGLSQARDGRRMPHAHKLSVYRPVSSVELERSAPVGVEKGCGGHIRNPAL